LSKQENKDGEHSIYLRLTRNRKHAYIALGISILEKDWDEVNSRVKKSHTNSVRLNNLISKKRAKIDDICLDLASKNDNFKVGLVKEIFLDNRSLNFIKYFDDYVTNFKSKGKIGTYKKVKTILEKLKEYLNHKDINFEDIDVHFLKNYEYYLLEVKKNSINTVHSNIKAFKTLFNKAIDESLISHEKNPFKAFKLKTEKVHVSYLTEEELTKIEDLQLNGDLVMEQHRKLFVFACYTGIRISDLLQLRWSDYDGERLKFIVGKTNNILTIRIVDKPKEILSYFEDICTSKLNGSLIFPFIKNNIDFDDPNEVHKAVSSNTAHINKNLKIIASKAGIEKHLTFHKSRHTFATRALRKGIRIEYVSKLLGHSSIEMTQHYAKIVNAELEEAMEVFNI